MKDLGDKSLDPQLWHACAGGMVQMPLVNSKVFYFPQGHAEHTLTNVDFGTCPRVAAMMLCRVAGVKFLADQETDEVYARMLLVPVGNNEHFYELDGENRIGNNHGSDTVADKPSSFAKTLTQSDANNGGGFSVPRYCAETIFPRLDYTADPPVQNVIAKDVHGETWKFRHIYRGTPRRHLLTTGWSNFVNQKKLVAGDSIVFLRADNGDLCVGIRRAKRGGLGGPESPSAGWNTGVGNYGGFSMSLREDENKVLRTASSGNLSGSGGGLRGRGKVSPESVMESVSLAARGQPFEIVYYPRASTPEFCVKASSVIAAMRVQWCSGMRFKMAFETEDSSRISWFMGTVASVQADPMRWPNSPWRFLQVTWDEPDLLQNVKCVSPWLVEIVSNMPVIHHSPFSPPRKKLCLPQQSDNFFDGQFPLPSFSGNPLGPSSPFCCLPDGITAGIQGARHAQYGGIPLLDLHHPSNKLQLGLLSSSCQQVDAYSKLSDGSTRIHRDGNDSLSCVLTIGNSIQKIEKSEKTKKPQFLLFGQPILTEQQMSHGCSRENSVVQPLKGKSSSGATPLKADFFDLGRKGLQHSLSSLLNQTTPPGFTIQGVYATELGLESGHCKVFMDSEDVGRSLDLSVLESYEELYKSLANMFGIERLDLQSNVLYCDEKGALRHIGDEPFSDFVKTAKRLTIVTNSKNTMGRMLITGLPTAERGLDSSKQAGRLSIFASVSIN
ncbi:hypothetical protein LIER_26165 [Lithospermum erythrorhizon]|uniref:Auxin response factor n=1 Tax=Lithospermum erythrorhizon TaxID=34254 RepID=A0AAV3RD92_LITER